MALAIAVGFVVDDAIVMVEVIWQRLEKGDTPLEAALKGSSEVSFTILSISISLVAVFTPLMFMGGVVGLLMREFAITLSAAVVISMVRTLTFTPMLCSRFLKPPKPPSNRILESLDHGFRWLEDRYARALDRVLEHKLITLVVFIGTECPISNLYILTLKEMHEKYAAKGVQILAVNSNDFDVKRFLPLLNAIFRIEPDEVI